jgi:hypothetical protein
MFMRKFKQSATREANLLLKNEKMIYGHRAPMRAPAAERNLARCCVAHGPCGARKGFEERFFAA